MRRVGVRHCVPRQAVCPAANALMNCLEFGFHFRFAFVVFVVAVIFTLVSFFFVGYDIFYCNVTMGN